VDVGQLSFNSMGYCEEVFGVAVKHLSLFESGTRDWMEPPPKDLGWKCLFHLDGHFKAITALCFVPCNDVVLASASMDERVTAKSENGWPVLVTSSADGTALIWKVEIQSILRDSRAEGKVMGNAYQLKKAALITVPGNDKLVVGGDVLGVRP
ncbi:hypothetical protein T484DRAFT_1776187, partial [Baffinella frigidus]